jgi:CRISPR-associated protein Csd1
VPGHLADLGAGRGGKKAARKYFLVPRPLPGSRRSGTKIDPAFLVDNASFVLGINAPGDKVKKAYSIDELTSRLEEFRALIVAAEQSAEAADDEGLRAVRLFLNRRLAGSEVSVPEELKSNELLGFRLLADGQCMVHQRPAVVAFWNRFRTARAAPHTATQGDFNCLVTGERCAPVDKHPLIKKVPGGTTAGIAFVSFNGEVFESYGLEGNENAPVSRTAAETYTTALTRLLDDSYPDPHTRTPMPRRNLRLSDDTAVLFWAQTESPVIDLFAESLSNADPEAVKALYGAPWKGSPVRLDDPSAFYALTLSGGQGRGTIRGWFESTVRDVLANVRRHFDDLDIIRPANDEDRSFPLWLLLRQTAVQSKSENVTAHLAAAVFEAILKGATYPWTLLDAAVRRARAERHIPTARAAVIKACLVRALRLGRLDPDFPEVKKMLDTECRDPAYRLGRLFAVLEKVQADATNASTTIRDRFYGAASATPLVVFPQLLRKAPHHYAKLDHAPYFEKLVQEIVSVLQPPAPFPAALSLEQQGLFAVGYYHQRQDLFKKKGDKGPVTNTNPTEGA